MMIRAGCDEIPIHRPVVILAEGKTIGGVIVVAIREGHEVRGVDERDVIPGGEADTEAAGGALVIVDFKDLAAEGGAAAVLEGLFCYAG